MIQTTSRVVAVPVNGLPVYWLTTTVRVFGFAIWRSQRMLGDYEFPIWQSAIDAIEATPPPVARPVRRTSRRDTDVAPASSVVTGDPIAATPPAATPSPDGGPR